LILKPGQTKLKDVRPSSKSFLKTASKLVEILGAINPYLTW